MGKIYGTRPRNKK